jgi:predicted transposase/invertase (TIGR01784 family)
MNLQTDWGFKFAFFKKQYLIHFLNSILEGKEQISKIDYLRSEHLGKTKKDRSAVSDVYCKTGRGEHIVVEMQNIPQEYYKNRALYYSSFSIQN